VAPPAKPAGILFWAAWIFLESEAASPAPMFSTILLMRGTCMTFL